MTKEQRVLDPYPCREPEIGRWLAALQDARRRTMRDLKGLSPVALDWPPPDGESSIGTMLYHLMQHEAEHRSQIGSLRARIEPAINQG